MCATITENEEGTRKCRRLSVNAPARNVITEHEFNMEGERGVQVAKLKLNIKDCDKKEEAHNIYIHF